MPNRMGTHHRQHVMEADVRRHGANCGGQSGEKESRLDSWHGISYLPDTDRSQQSLHAYLYTHPKLDTGHARKPLAGVNNMKLSAPTDRHYSATPQPASIYDLTMRKAGDELLLQL